MSDGLRNGVSGNNFVSSGLGEYAGLKFPSKLWG